MISKWQLMSDVQAHGNLRDRVLAIVMNDRWDKGGDVTAPIDLENIMWAVAANDTITAKVVQALEDAPEGDEANVHKALLGGVDDSDLEYVVVSVALPKLASIAAAVEAGRPDPTRGVDIDKMAQAEQAATRADAK